MTDTPTITTLVHKDVALSPMTADQVATMIHRFGHANAKRFLVKARGGEGVGVLGLYLEAVLFDALGHPHSHLKYFVVGTNLYAYSRLAHEARANWRRREVPSLAHALTSVQTFIDRPNVTVLGHPVLVELTSDDLSNIESKAMPPARFRGQTRIERDFGRYDFKMPVVTAEMTATAIKLLHKPAPGRTDAWRAPAAAAPSPF
jgi:hypothetical protein